MTKPWDSDTHLDEAQVASLLAAQHPDLPVRSIRRMDQGWDNDLFVVNDDILFRFTRRDFVIPFAKTELAVLALLKDRFSVAVPHILHSGLLQEKYPWFSYRMIPGTIAANLGLTTDERRNLAIPLVNLLNEIHDPEPPEDLLQVLPPDSIGRLDITKRIFQVRSTLGVTLQLGVDFPLQIVDELAALIDPQETQRINCLVHGDLYARNLLIADRNRISGLIDWTDVHLGHPAKDFAFAISFFPPSVFHMVANRYRLFDMPLFHLSVMSALNLTCYLTEYALDINDRPLIEECRISFLHIRDNFLASR